ncbi:nitrous oxide reductase family maturation protein NosD [Pararhizobium antarcticum]|uniref:Carbohydrate-binding protein n=1 Tax=Pararhizobium antarcticum TaxID=1798805 RepID=A0A657LN99_9HYPH|nr:nitrous oxide reductase family maturation protein NosD [Pararhizobium antarcticum]OJF92825.1 carbohydrate-binding protein [Pararhizobium antarcticum]OJF96149.1 carbohydrate-binding protein [Rhizobium sp. 58]
MMHLHLRFAATAFGMAALLAAVPAMTYAAERTVTVAEALSLQTILNAASPGDIIILEAGEYAAPITVDKAVTLAGKPGASVIGNGKGSVITITAPGAAVRGLIIAGSGRDLATLDSGVLAQKTATNARIEDNVIAGNLFGIYLHGAVNSLARANRITGLSEGRRSSAGNGVTVWNAPGARVLDNDIRSGRDGIATMASKRNVFRGNSFRDLRFGIHYMYTNDSEIADNISIGNSVGYAVMFSNRLKITGNRSEGDRDHGLLLNSANGSTITDNTVVGSLQPVDRWLTAGAQSADLGVPKSIDAASKVGDVGGLRLGPEKCVFIYNANKNKFSGNRFEGCATGIHFTAGSEGNAMSGNAFVNNRNQVKYVGTRYMDWSKDGRGNYWSDNPAFDLNGDGIGDSPYRPNDLIDRVLWTSPQAKVLTSSPAVQVIRWAQSQFPALLPGGVVDSYPLMAPLSYKDKRP